MLLAARERGFDVIYFEQEGDLLVVDGCPEGRGRKLAVNRSLDAWFEFGEAWSGPLNTLDVLLMRKDPPFDMEFIYTTYILELARQQGLMVVNSPSSLREINEKGVHGPGFRIARHRV